MAFVRCTCTCTPEDGAAEEGHRPRCVMPNTLYILGTSTVQPLSSTCLCLSFCLSVCLYVCLSACVSVCLPVGLSLSLPQACSHISLSFPLSLRMEWPTTKTEWISLMRRHLESHEAERQKCLDTVSSLVSALEQVLCMYMYVIL